MKFLVGLSGTHGTGKSTILHGVKDEGFNVDQSQLSRTAQKQLGWESLSKAQESADNMWQLQQSILAAMYDRDYQIQASKKVTMVERTPADVWAYTEMWCKRLNIDIKTDKQAVLFKQQCRKLAENYAKILIVPISNNVKFVSEHNRADLESRDEVQNSIRQFLLSGGLNFSTIKTSNAKYRISEAASTMLVIKVMKEQYD